MFRDGRTIMLLPTRDPGAPKAVGRAGGGIVDGRKDNSHPHADITGEPRDWVPIWASRLSHDQSCEEATPRGASKFVLRARRKKYNLGIFIGRMGVAREQSMNSLGAEIGHAAPENVPKATSGRSHTSDPLFP